jgi:MFS family permease
MILVGCSIRIVGFGLFAALTQLWAIVVATVLVGLATSFFNPAVRTYLSAETTGRRAEAFGLFNIAGNTGGLLGPVIGGLLITFDFRYVAFAGAVLFVFLTIAQVFLLPQREMEKPVGTIWANWWEVARNRRFAVFTIAGAAFALMNTQVYFAMVMEAARVTGRNESATLVYLVSALFAASAQVKVTHWSRLRWTSGQAMAVGVAVTGLGWAPMIISAPLTPTVPHATSIAAGVIAMSPVLLGAVILTLGNTIANPFMMELIPVVGSERMMGTYYGYYSLIGGVATAGGSALIGASMGSDQAAWRWAPFAILLVLGVIGGAILWLMHRVGALEPREEA